MTFFWICSELIIIILGNNVGKGFVPEIVEKLNSTGKGCWAINYAGQWRQFPCKNYQLPALCEVLPFPS